MIPKWNSSGILPPIRLGVQGHSTERSPYHVSINEVVNSFAFSEKRRGILKGFLNYREALYQVGITQGFQWIDGSFIEDVERLENRAPNDLDIVTFFHLPHGMNQQELLQKYDYLFMPDQIKQMYQIDGYICLLGEPMESRHVQQISYWYSMWSHRRNHVWKGFLQVGLSKNEDELASKTLDLRGQS
jgi:hypothetical protein